VTSGLHAGGDLALKRRVAQNTLLVFYSTFAVVWFPGTAAVALLAATIVATCYGFAQVLLTRYCGSCGLSFWSLGSSRARPCSSCGGACTSLWRSAPALPK